MRLSELPCDLTLHEIADDATRIGEFRVESALVCHPGPTVGYRITDGKGRVVTYLPDHEPALGAKAFPSTPMITFGSSIAAAPA